MLKARTFPLDSGWLILLKDLGVTPSDVLRRAGLPDDLLTRPQAQTTVAQYFNFVRALEAALDDPLFALRVVDAISAEIFSPPLFAALCSANLRQAAGRLSHYKRLFAPMSLEITPRSQGDLMLIPRWIDHTVEPPLSLMTIELAFLLRLARLATRESVQAIHVTLPRIPEPTEPYSQYFGTPITKGLAASIRFSAQDADRPFLTTSDVMWTLFEPGLRIRLAELDASAGMGERVRSLLRELLPTGQVSIHVVTQRLAVSKRTLQRRLNEEGLTFQDLVQVTREELARHYLTRTQLSNGEIAFLLGFEDTSSFFRAFSSWTGTTPRSIRTGFKNDRTLAP